MSELNVGASWRTPGKAKMMDWMVGAEVGAASRMPRIRKVLLIDLTGGSGVPPAGMDWRHVNFNGTHVSSRSLSSQARKAGDCGVRLREGDGDLSHTSGLVRRGLEWAGIHEQEEVGFGRARPCAYDSGEYERERSCAHHQDARTLSLEQLDAHIGGIDESTAVLAFSGSEFNRVTGRFQKDSVPPFVGAHRGSG